MVTAKMRLSSYGGNMAEHSRDRQRARTGSRDIDVFGVGDIACSIDCLEQRFNIRVHIPIVVFNGWIAPTHRKHLEAALEQVFDERATGREVEQIKFVDLRRHDD